MSNEIQKRNNEVTKTGTSAIKTKIGQGMMAGVLAGLSTIELPRMFNQLVIFLLDGSGSMTYSGTSGKSKGYEVHQAVVNVLQRLIESKNKSSFDVAFWAYAKEAVQMFALKPIINVDLTKDCFNPCEFITDYKRTFLTETLVKAREQAYNYLEKYKDQNTKVLIIVLGDGAINDYSACLTLKEEISKKVDISFSSILFESTNWQEELDEITIEKWKQDFAKLASTQADYMSTVDAEKIRSHMIQSITKVSKI
jgi:hypothetical protein